jgi:hypothetical protein
MSEPMSSVEIEDVLSSIRRLVSDDLRPLHRPTPPAAAFRPLNGGRDGDRAAPQGTDRLILTPALRVVRSQESPTKTVIAALEVAVEAQDEPWESETGDAAPTAETRDMGGLPWDDDVWEVVAERALHDRQAPAPRVIDSIRTALPEQDGEESAAVGDTASWDQEAGHDVDAGTEAPQVDAAAGQPDEAATPSDPDWLAQAEAEVLASLAQDTAEEVTEVFTSRRNALPVHEEDDDAITFDEEVLRDLVRDLIREELHGALGERITRNIRKLVRAEISRMLTAQACE